MNVFKLLFVVGLIALPAGAAASSTDEAAMRDLVVIYLEKIQWGDQQSRYRYAQQNTALFLEHARKKGVSGRDIAYMRRALGERKIRSEWAGKARGLIQHSAAWSTPKRTAQEASVATRSLQESRPIEESSGSSGASSGAVYHDDDKECYDDLACEPAADPPPDPGIWEDIKIEIGKVWAVICCVVPNSPCCGGEDVLEGGSAGCCRV